MELIQIILKRESSLKINILRTKRSLNLLIRVKVGNIWRSYCLIFGNITAEKNEVCAECFDLVTSAQHKTPMNDIFNPNKAGLFEGSFFWGGVGGQFTPPFIFQEELI